MRKASVPTIVLLLFGFGMPGWALAGYGEGVAAYKRGDYISALREFRRLAKQDDAEAQRFLGGMHLFGRGVPQSDTEAAKWYKMAAELGNAKAQYRLGGMYYTGRAVPQDRVVAHMWFILSGSSGDPHGIKWRDATAARMTAAQVAEAQRLARERMAKFGASRNK